MKATAPLWFLTWIALTPWSGFAAGPEFAAVGESTHVPHTCVWAASEAFREAWNACDQAGYLQCDGAGPYQVLEQREGYCRATVKIIGSNGSN